MRSTSQVLHLKVLKVTLNIDQCVWSSRSFCDHLLSSFLPHQHVINPVKHIYQSLVFYSDGSSWTHPYIYNISVHEILMDHHGSSEAPEIVPFKPEAVEARPTTNRQSFAVSVTSTEAPALTGGSLSFLASPVFERLEPWCINGALRISMLVLLVPKSIQSCNAVPPCRIYHLPERS